MGGNHRPSAPFCRELLTLSQFVMRYSVPGPLESTFVVIEEVETENWGWGGLPVLDYRRQRPAAGK